LQGIAGLSQKDKRGRKGPEGADLRELVFVENRQGPAGAVLIALEIEEHPVRITYTPLLIGLFHAQAGLIQRYHAQPRRQALGGVAIGEPVFQHRPGLADAAILIETQFANQQQGLAGQRLIAAEIFEKDIAGPQLPTVWRPR